MFSLRTLSNTMCTIWFLYSGWWECYLFSLLCELWQLFSLLLSSGSFTDFMFFIGDQLHSACMTNCSYWKHAFTINHIICTNYLDRQIGTVQFKAPDVHNSFYQNIRRVQFPRASQGPVKKSGPSGNVQDLSKSGLFPACGPT